MGYFKEKVRILENSKRTKDTTYSNTAQLRKINGTPPTSTVGRSKTVDISDIENIEINYKDDFVQLCLGNSLDHYKTWDTPTTIISDGGYGLLGFEGDTSDHFDLPDWYEPHIKAWSKYATAQTSLWFWNSEIGWASVHPILERYGWRFITANSWNKGKGHIAGNVNTAKIRRFPVVTELCVHYVFEARIDDLILRDWMRREWKRTGLTWKSANAACGVKDAATRKYLDSGHLWYYPPPEMFEKMVKYANEKGLSDGRPYFSYDGKSPMTASDWIKMRAKFYCPHGYTNIWERNSLRGKERIKAPKRSSKAAHLNQKPLDLMSLIIEATTDPGDVIWEPFGGLFSACLSARNLKRKAFSCEIDPVYFNMGINRFNHY